MRLACAAMLALAGVASAQPSPETAAAEAAFDRGRALAKAGQWPDACVAFERSQKLDPQLGTLFNIAECDAHIGKLASAWAAYRELASRDTNTARRDRSRELAVALEPRLPKLAIAGAHVDGLVLTMNGRDATSLVGTESPIDLGTFALVATAPGYDTWRDTIVVNAEAQTVRATITLHRAPEPARPAAAVVVAPLPPASPSHRSAYGFGALGLGVALVGGGLFAGHEAEQKRDAARALCADSMTCATASDLSNASALESQAVTRARIADVLFGAAVVAAGAGVYLLVTRPHAETPLTAALRIVVGPGSIGLAGGF